MALRYTRCAIDEFFTPSGKVSAAEVACSTWLGCRDRSARARFSVGRISSQERGRAYVMPSYGEGFGKHIYGLSDEGVCDRWVYDPYFQHFTGFEVFQHDFPHERSDLSHWRKRLGDKLKLVLAESLRVAHEAGALRTRDLKRVTVDILSAQGHHLPDRRQAGPCGDQGA